ncbi:hypothetical protein [Polaromonas jejuensis]|uniref:Uncharacterized protein n=1 Tax=Polaromonas jejuensis TaxID=457502 RepID=A0ABW0QDL8_9BURK|nr:hypothetical protein [Polaromonas jejuensis]
MNRYRDATVASETHDASALARYIESFAEASSKWALLAEKSAEYEKLCGAPSCCIVTASSALPHAAIHLTVPREGKRSLTVANIIPLSASRLSVAEYNAVLVSFARALRARSRLHGTRIKVVLSKADIRLADVVTGKVTWKLLQRYLALHPLSHHPLDIQRLDAFTCAISRYTRKSFDLDSFQVLLMEELGWSAEDASWCRSRVEVGLDVLAASRRFDRR